MGAPPRQRPTSLRLIASNPGASRDPDDPRRGELKLVSSRRFVLATPMARPVEVLLPKSADHSRRRGEAVLVLTLAAAGVAALAAAIGQVLAPLLD